MKLAFKLSMTKDMMQLPVQVRCHRQLLWIVQ
jgi:hypothetical protein